MPYHRRPGERCCYNCENSDFCPWEKINNQTTQLRNLQNALQRKKIMIKILCHLPNMKSQEIEKLMSELEETKKNSPKYS